MNQQMYFAVSGAIAFAAVVLLIAIAFFIKSQPALIPILLFGSLGLIVDLVLIRQYWFTLLPLALYMYGLIHYILDRGQYPTNVQMAATDKAVPSWAKTTPNASARLEQMDRSRRHSYETIYSTGERPLVVHDLIKRSAAERAQLKTN